MKTELRLALREITGSRAFSLFFAFNLMVGLIGFTTLDAFKRSTQDALARQSKLILTADLSVASHRPLTADEDQRIRHVLGPQAREGRTIELFSMVAGPVSATSTGRLTDIQAIDSTYPFYGVIKLRKGGTVQGRAPGPGQVWVDPDLMVQLGVEDGGMLHIGEKEFHIEDEILAESGTAGRAFSLAPRLLLGLDNLPATGLIQQGSTISYERFYQIPENLDSEVLAHALDQTLEDPGIRINTHRSAAEDMGRSLAYLSDYLGLIALVALALAALGTSYLFRSFLARKLPQIAVMRSLGATTPLIRRIYLIQLALMGLVSSLSASALCAVILPPLAQHVGRELPVPVEAHLSLGTALLSLLIGVGGSVLICWPLFTRLEELRPAALFQEAAEDSGSSHQTLRKLALHSLPAVLGFSALCFWQAHSWILGGTFLGGFAASLALLTGAGSASLALINRASQNVRHPLVKYALRNLARSKASSLSCFLALSLGVLMVNLMPQIQSALQKEIEQPPGLETPSLFLFDIQEEQLSGVLAVAKNDGVRVLSPSPMIRARLRSINDAPFEKADRSKDGARLTREEEQEARSRNRGFNLSYRDHLDSSESLVDQARGLAPNQLFTGRYDPAAHNPAELSLEHKFAQRMHIKLGDILVFDVQGIPVRTQVTTLRKVRWTSFQPNFFVLVQPGALDDAPKTFLASTPRLEPKLRDGFQRHLIARFPNVSVLDVSLAVQKLLEIFSQMSWALQVMALISLFAGSTVLFSIAHHQASQRAREASLLKVLGASQARVQATYQLEFGVLGLLAAVFGVLPSFAFSYAISALLFEGAWFFTWHIPLATVLILPAAAILLSTVATRRTLARKPLDLISGS